MKYKKLDSKVVEEKIIFYAMNDSYEEVGKKYVKIIQKYNNDIIIGNMIEGVAVMGRRFGIFDFDLLNKILNKNINTKYTQSKIVDLKDDFELYFKKEINGI